MSFSDQNIVENVKISPYEAWQHMNVYQCYYAAWVIKYFNYL